MTDFFADAETLRDSEVEAMALGRHQAWLDGLRWAWGWAGRLAAHADAYAHADADADAYAYAYAHADADAFAYAGADVDAIAYAHAYSDPHAYADAIKPIKGIHAMPLTPGLYLFATPSSDSTAVLRVAWIRPVGGGSEDHEVHHAVTPLRVEYQTMFADAQDAPPVKWQWTVPLKRRRSTTARRFARPSRWTPRATRRCAPGPRAGNEAPAKSKWACPQCARPRAGG